MTIFELEALIVLTMPLATTTNLGACIIYAK
jgi:hypothetical protein